MSVTETIVYDLIALVMTTLVLLIAYFKWQFTYWNRVGLPTLNPVIPFGDSKELFLSRLSFGEQFRVFYKKFKAQGHKHGGVYLGPKPFYVPVDPEILKHIMQKNFDHFVNHGFYVNKEDDPLTAHLFNLEDSKWRDMRAKLTPTFTSGKMKMMFQTIKDCATTLESIILDSATSRTPVEIKDILCRYNTDIVGSVGFGIECNSLKDPDAEFCKYGKKATDDWKNKMRLFAAFALPRKLLKAIKFRFTAPEVEEFFMTLVRDTVSYREKNNVFRRDFMHLLLQLKNRGTVTDDEKVTGEDGKVAENALTIKELAAQAYVFLLAGHETSSTTLTFTLYELAANPELQDRLREEIREVLAKHDGQLTYDAVSEMKYVGQVINETLRIYSPVGFMTRQCSKDYNVPDSDVCLKKGVDVAIPILALHSDPEYYPDPEKFDPERFSEVNASSRPPFTFIPFGEGPRLCIGQRFSFLTMKVCLISMIKNYRLKINDKTPIPLEFDKNAFVTTLKEKLWLDVEKVDQEL